MSVDFETPTAALFARLSNISGIRFATRILEDWDNSAPAKQPALMLTSGPILEMSVPNSVPGQTPPLWKLQLLVVLYVQAPSATIPASSVLNPLIAGVCNALLRQGAEMPAAGARFPGNPAGAYSTTLGGLCAYCRTFGTIERAEGLIGKVAAANIPIELVLTS